MNSKRLNIVASFIEKEDKIVDVGCDHAYLSKILESKGISSVATDIVESIINKRLQEDFKLTTFIISDGLKNVDESLYDTVVMTGMGAHTILKIINDSNKNFKKVITIANSKNELLRTEMNKLGFKIKCEQIIYENNIYYNIIVFIKGSEKLTEEELLFGKNHIDKDALKQKKEYLKEKYSNYKHLPKTSNILKFLKYLN